MLFSRKRRKRNIRLSLSINREGEIAVRAPAGFPQEKINAFIKKHEGWIAKQLEAHRKYIYLPEGVGTKRHFAKNKEEARKYITERVDFLNASLGFAYSKIAIRNQVSRWGSCSKKGILNFNYRLLFLPPELADYVIVHELCHLKHFNHSKEFWNEVSRACPDYLACRRELKKYRM